MDKKIMMAEIFAARQEMGLEELKDLGKRSTERLEKLHTKTMYEFRLWTEEQERIAALPKNPEVLLAVQAGLIDQAEEKESEMKDDKKKKSDKKKSATPKKEAPFAVTERLAFEALAATVWEEADMPDIPSMTDDAVAEELKESISLLAPEDEVTVLNMDHGPELWAYLSGMMKERAALAVKPKKEKEPKEPKAKKEKAEKSPGPPGVIASIKEFLIASGEDGISKKGLLTKLVERFPGKKEDSMKATINVQVPSRLAKENNLTIKKLTDNGETRYLIA